MKKVATTVEVLENKLITSNFYLLSLQYEGTEPEPGQFVNLSVEPFFLKRPFAVFDFDKKNKVLKLLYKKVGKGTETMSVWEKGLKAEILCPLGNGFDLASEDSVMIAGGTGIASVYYLSRKLKGKRKIFIGLTDKNEAEAFQTLFQESGAEFIISTLKGDYGFHGNVIDCAVETLKGQKDYTVYACGPEGMFLSLDQKINEQKLLPGKTFVSMEGRMGCGFGVCLGCAVEKKGSDQFFYVCKDGPVFHINEINWKA
ncbi:MAG TPA: hypothetical protein DHW82_14305 [Spirochaetia bacterium]|nr:MAG: hypothetical protein A2Y41_12165 [Spirochaetes bacterium GWB1_36_13]HCL58163.1 hypothetical protein [Spirochaetia bacterium]